MYIYIINNVVNENRNEKEVSLIKEERMKQEKCHAIEDKLKQCNEKFGECKTNFKNALDICLLKVFSY